MDSGIIIVTALAVGITLYFWFMFTLLQYTEKVHAHEELTSWVDLTDQDKREIINKTERDDRSYVIALVSAKLKEKNT